MSDLHYAETRTDDVTNAAPEPKPEIPRIRTCPLCGQRKAEAQFKYKIYLDDVLTKVCSRCYSIHRRNPYSGFLYG